MAELLKILFVEDLVADYELALREIRGAGIKFEHQRVETQDQLLHMLPEFKPDIVISDYSMPGFDGRAALKVCREYDPFLPFIMFTGSMNEETAVECLKAGATDYVIKESRKRLPFALKEALERRKVLLQKEEALSRLYESEYQLKQAQKIANIGSWEYDLSRGMAKVSEQARNIFGVPQEYLPIDILHKVVVDKYMPLLEDAFYQHKDFGKPYNIEFQIVRGSDQELRYLHAIAEYSSQKNSLVGIVRDITEKKSNEKLKQDILVAKEAARFKQDFLAHISHEIRTPLTAIEGMIELFSKTSLSATQKDYLDTVQFSSENLKNIINEVLDFSRIEAGKIKLKPVKFPSRELFLKAEKLFQSICKKPIDFQVRGAEKLPKYINADKHRVFQIITNLISNAVKYSNEGTITMEITASRINISHSFLFKVSVRDQGPGIHPQLKKKLFKPFSQIHEQAEEIQIEGTGLGLSICKELALLLKGEIDVESKQGEGSTFWFTFIAEEVEESKKGYTSSEFTNIPSGERSLRILLAEDKDVNQKVISLILSSMGHKIEVAGNGKEALDKFKAGEFDLILMDIQMPVMDGIAATQKLKSTYDQLPPIVGLSANALEGDREKFMAKGMDEYIIKPVKSNDFKKLIRRLGL